MRTDKNVRNRGFFGIKFSNPFRGLFGKKSELAVHQPQVATPPINPEPTNLREAIEQRNIDAALRFAKSLTSKEKYALLFSEDENNISLILHSAVALKNPDLVKELLSGFNNEQVFNTLKCQNASGQTPLNLATGLDKADIMKVMIEALSRVDENTEDKELMKNRRMTVLMIPNGMGDTFFHRIAANNLISAEEKVDIVRSLELSVSDKISILGTQSSNTSPKPGETKPQKPSKSTMLHFAMSIPSSTPLIEIMIDGIPKYNLEPIIDIQNGNGDTCLHNASRNGSFDSLVLVLNIIKPESKLQKRSSVTSLNSMGDSAMGSALSGRGGERSMDVFLSSLNETELSDIINHMKEVNPVTKEVYSTKYPDMFLKMERKLIELRAYDEQPPELTKPRGGSIVSRESRGQSMED